MLAAFDIVVSFGVVEHFEHTAGCLKALSQFLKPGGLAITIIPNMVGLPGYFQKVINRRVFDVHVPLDNRALAANHEPSLNVLSCSYFLFVNWGAINMENWEGQMSYRLGTRLRSWMSKGFWVLEDLAPIIFKPNRLSSPYINCVAQKPCA
jgi:SAM-dependent methyltransferase